MTQKRSFISLLNKKTEVGSSKIGRYQLPTTARTNTWHFAFHSAPGRNQLWVTQPVLEGIIRISTFSKSYQWKWQGKTEKPSIFSLLLLFPLKTKTSSTVFPQGCWLGSSLILPGSETLFFNIPSTLGFHLQRQCPQWEQILQAFFLDGMTMELDNLIMHLPGCLGDSWLGLGCNLWLWNRTK